MRYVERERVAGPPEGELGELDEPHHERAHDDADRDGVDPEERRRENGEQDDHEVVDERCRRAGKELAVRVQDAGRQRGETHEDRRQQHEPREIDRERELGRPVDEPRCDDRGHEPRRGDPHHRREADEKEQDRIHHARRHVPRLVFTLAR